MSLNIRTNDNKYIQISDINPYNDIKLLISLLPDLENEDNNNIEDKFKIIEEYENYEIELNASYFILDKIFSYAMYMYNIKDINITQQDIYNYINDYLDCKNEIICELLNTADYLQYDILVDVICDKIADDIQKCDSIETLKKNFNIKNIISSEEEEELIKNIQ
tara:strand:+ start:35 stop:526 length:492 start_codon:yes stop_codon:yes gene_type:complete